MFLLRQLSPTSTLIHGDLLTVCPTRQETFPANIHFRIRHYGVHKCRRLIIHATHLNGSTCGPHSIIPAISRIGRKTPDGGNGVRIVHVFALTHGRGRPVRRHSTADRVVAFVHVLQKMVKCGMKPIRRLSSAKNRRTEENVWVCEIHFPS